MKIFWYSDFFEGLTGYGNQTRLICEQLMARGHEILFGTLGTHEAKIHEVSFCGKQVKVFGFGMGKFLNPDAIKEIYAVEKFDVLISLCDWQMVEGMMGLSDHPAFSKWIHWAPVDGNMLAKDFDFLIHFIPYIVYLSPQYAQKVVAPRTWTNVSYIPHAVDPVFQILPNTAEIKRSSKLKMGWDLNSTTVLMVGRNQWRKNIPEIIKAASIAEQDNSSGAVKINWVLHTMARESMGWDLPALCEHYGTKTVAISEPKANREILNQIYLSADLFILPSMGEGFGIPIMEAARTRLPVLATLDTASFDMVKWLEWNEFGFDFETYWQNGPTLPRPYVCAEEIYQRIKAFVNFSKENPIEVNDRINHAEQITHTLSPQNIAAKWEEVMFEAERLNNARFGKEIFCGGRTWVK